LDVILKDIKTTAIEMSRITFEWRQICRRISEYGQDDESASLTALRVKANIAKMSAGREASKMLDHYGRLLRYAGGDWRPEAGDPMTGLSELDAALIERIAHAGAPLKLVGEWP